MVMNPTGPCFLLFDQGGRPHVLVGAVGKNIKPPLDGRGAQCGENLFLVGELAVVAAMIRQHHVHDEAGDEDEDRRHYDREPKSSERNHVQPP